MIILKIKNNAGPGNQMFMYAKAYALAKKYGHKILMVSEISGYSVRQNILQKFLLDKTYIKGMIRLDWTQNQYIFRLFRKLIFDCVLKLPFLYQITQKDHDSRVYMDIETLKKGKIYVLDGYWECHAYFDEYRKDLIQQFQPKYALSAEVQEFCKRVESENSLAVHIRKGDFQAFDRLISDEYYRKALKTVQEKYPDVKVYILTEADEIAEEWKKQYGAIRIEFDTDTKFLDEWFVMSKCRHHVIANSTYSWWSSYLSNSPNKMVVVPSVEEYLEAEKDNTEQMYRNYYYILHKEENFGEEIR